MSDDKQVNMIKNMLPTYLDIIGVSTQQPFNCLNPNHDDKHPSMNYDKKDGQHVKCFSCDVYWDIFDLIAVQEFGAVPNEKNELDYSFNKVFNKAIDILNLDISKRNGNQKQDKTEQNSSAQAASTKQANKVAEANAYIIEQAHKLLSPTKFEAIKDRTNRDQNKAHIMGSQYLYKRGLSDQLIDRFNLGFINDWQSPTAMSKGYNPEGSPRLIIPTSDTSYIARDTRDKSELNESEQKYVKMKEGNVHIFNIQALQKNQPIFIVEGEIDALSIIETGKADAIGLGSVANIDIFMRELDRYGHQRQGNFYPTLLIALDNDKAGQRAINKLETQLDNRKVANYVVQIARKSKDANEALVNNRLQFIRDVEQAVKDPDNRLQGLLDYINHNSEVEAIPTGFKNLDKVLDGGLYEGLYGIGAVSSLGKTTLALQIADNIAEFSKRPVLYFALEMGTYEMMTKSISRLTIENSGGETKLAQTTRSLLKGKWKQRYNQAQYNNVMQSFKRYGDFYNNVVIHDGSEKRPTIADIDNTVSSYVARTGNKPVVMIDYLQIMKPMNDRATDKANVTTSVNGMKKLATKFHIPVIVISSFNRLNYNNPVSMEAFKESGDIEYSTDVLIGLQFKGTGENGFDINKARRESPRQIEAVILKNRNGATGDTLNFYYYSMFNKYMDADNGYEPSEVGDVRTQVDEDGRVITPNYPPYTKS